MSLTPSTKSDQPILKLENLTVHRDGSEQPVLRGIDWRVERGEHWAILGRNGSGKTSLLLTLAGYLAPRWDSSLYFDGEKFGRTDWREIRTRIGLVSPWISERVEEFHTALQVVAAGRYAMINLREDPGDADHRDAVAIIKTLGCENLSPRPWRALSLGERQKILIGRALMARHLVLILDEPCAGLDPVARHDFLTFIDRLAARGDAPVLLYVTHHVEDIFPSLTHVLLLDRGKKIIAGPLKEILTDENLSLTYGTPVRLHKEGSGYRLVIPQVGGTP